MRSRVLSNRICLLKKACSMGVLAVAVAGCSSGFQRFDNSFYQSAAPQAPAQQPQTAYSNYNNYPGAQGNLDAITTASIRQNGPRRLAPLTNVAPVQPNQPLYHQPEPTYVTPQATYQQPQAYRQPYQQQSNYQPPKPQTNYQPPNYQPQVNRQPVTNYKVQPVYKAPAPEPKVTREATLRDNVVTRQILPRFKKPVKKPAIPKITYNPPEAAKAPVYNPPIAAAQPQTVYIPPTSADPVTTASIRPQVQQVQQAQPQYTQQPIVQNTVANRPAVSNSPDGWTSAGGTTITVREGETLYNLSKRYGVPVAAIQNANGISAERGLQTGQRVVIPNYIFSASSPISAPDNNPKTRAARASTGYLGEAQPDHLAIPTKRPYYVAPIAQQPIVQDNARVASNTQFQSNQQNVDPVVTNSVKPTRRRSNVAVVDTTTKAPASSGISQFRWPVKGRVVSNFGQSGSIGKNEGIDISVPEGTAIKAAENGVVIYAGNEISSYGNLVLIRHDNDFVSAYAHAKDFSVKKGDRVVRGQTIARSGKTGSADRPKLHFELRKDSSPVDPRKYLAG